jgi:hypothetical protein
MVAVALGGGEGDGSAGWVGVALGSTAASVAGGAKSVGAAGEGVWGDVAASDVPVPAWWLLSPQLINARINKRAKSKMGRELFNIRFSYLKVWADHTVDGQVKLYETLPCSGG